MVHPLQGPLNFSPIGARLRIRVAVIRRHAGRARVLAPSAPPALIGAHGLRPAPPPRPNGLKPARRTPKRPGAAQGGHRKAPGLGEIDRGLSHSLQGWPWSVGGIGAHPRVGPKPAAGSRSPVPGHKSRHRARSVEACRGRSQAIEVPWSMGPMFHETVAPAGHLGHHALPMRSPQTPSPNS